MSIASRIENMETNISKAYKSVEGLGADLTGVDKNLENLSVKIDEIYDEMPKVEGTGTNITLENTKKGKMVLDLKGNTYQDNTQTGKNKIPNIKNTQTINGITFTKNTDGSVTANGTASARTDLYFVGSSEEYEDLGLSAGSYTLSGCPSTGSSSTYMLICVVQHTDTSTNTYIDNGTGVSVSIQSGDKFRIFIRVTNGTSINDTFYPQLELGNKTSYEPFIPNSPSPDYPQEIHNVSGDNTIEICGKNLLPFENINVTKNGLNIYSSNGNLYINGTNSSPIYSTEKLFEFTLNAGTFTSSPIVSGTPNYFLRKKSDNTTINESNRTFTLNETTDVYLCAFIGANTYNNYQVSWQLEKGSTSSEYEAYTGNSQLISLGVENLLKYPYRNTTKTENGITFTDIGDGTIKVNGTASANAYFYLTTNNDDTYKQYNGKKLTISGCPSGGGNNTYQIGFYSDNFSVGTTDNGSGGTFTGGDVRYNQSYIKINSGVQCDNLIFKPQLEKGSKKNSYTSYGTTPIELCKIGDYQDYIYKESDKWYLHKEIGKVVLDGSEEWGLANNVFYKSNNKGLQQTGIKIVKSNYFQEAYNQPSTSNVNTYNSDNSICGSSVGTNRFYIKCTSITSTENFKTWLSTHNTTVYYVLATPVNILLNDTLQETLNSFVSYQEQTNISQSNNDLPFVIKASALKDFTTLE